MFASRAPWSSNELDVFIAAPESIVKKHPRYPAAKAGDSVASWSLV